MTYLKIAWAHKSEEFPTEIFSELDSERYEMRKIELFRDGTVRVAGPEGTPSEEYLSETAFPLDEEIAKQPQLEVLATSKEEFEQLWQSAAISTAA